MGMAVLDDNEYEDEYYTEDSNYLIIIYFSSRFHLES